MPALRYWHPCVIRNGVLMETSAEDFGPDLYAGLIDFIKRKRTSHSSPTIR